MTKNYIFDFGNVLVRFDPEELTEAYAENQEDRRQISQAVFDRIYWDRLDNGTITDEEIKEAVRNRLPDRLHEAAFRTYDRWIENLPPIEGMEELLLEIKGRGGRLFLLSNISKGFAYGYQDVPHIAQILSHFDGLVFSGPLGLTKPSREIFFHLLESCGLEAGETVFIDDSPKNIAGAEAVGIQSILFDGNPDQLRRVLFSSSSSPMGALKSHTVSCKGEG